MRGVVLISVIGEAWIRIRPDDAGFSQEAEKGILGKVGGIATKAAGIFAAGFAIKQGADFFGGLVKDAEESRRVLAETEQAIKATGGAAGVTAGQVSDLSESLARQTGIDDELIQTGANLLLTFRNIRNETGKGNDVFNQANQAVLDLSKQFGGVEASAVQVGKALNDPVAGITALGRVGVQFTDKQKDMIEALVETGDVLGAQKIILGELNAQVGGQAAAQATAADKLRVVWGNLREELGARLLPIVDKVATFLADRLPSALDKTGKVLGPVFTTISQAVRSFVAAFVAADGDITSSGFNGKMERIGFIVSQVAGFIRNNLQPILIALGAAFLIAAGPVVAIGAALVLLYTRFEVVRTVIGAVAEFLTGTVVPAIAAFVGFVSEQFANLTAFVRENWAGIQEAISHVIVVVRAIIEEFVGFVQVIWRAWGDEILNIVSIVWDQIRNVIDTAVGIISGLITAGLAIINGEWGAAWDAIVGILETAWNYIKETVSNAIGVLREVVEGGISAVVAIVGDLPGRALDALSSMVGFFADVGERAVRAMANAISGAIDWVLGAAGSLVSKVKDKLMFWESPPEAFGLHLGQRLVRGLADGLSETAKAEAAATKLVESIRAKFSGRAGGQTPGAALGAGLAGAAKQYFDYALESGDWLNDYLTEVAESERAALKALAQRAIAEKQAAVNSGSLSQSSVDPYYLRPDRGFRPSSPSSPSGSAPISTTVRPPVMSTGPLIGQLVIHANGNGREIATAVEDSIRRLVADGTVGRAMSKRSQTFATR